jgi:hypothetical protein
VEETKAECDGFTYVEKRLPLQLVAKMMKTERESGN